QWIKKSARPQTAWSRGGQSGYDCGSKSVACDARPSRLRAARSRSRWHGARAHSCSGCWNPALRMTYHLAGRLVVQLVTYIGDKLRRLVQVARRSFALVLHVGEG